jgi:hypothetical protein
MPSTQVNFGAFNLNAWQQVLSLAASQFKSDATVGAFTLAQGEMTGALTCYLALTAGGGAVNVTTRTATQLYNDFVAAFGGPPLTTLNYEFTVTNTGGGTVTLVGGTGVTINGTATVANNASRTWLVSFPTPTTCTLQETFSGSN